MNVNNYKIRHVDLSHNVELGPSLLSPDPLYFVFWYKSIPLGDLYFQPWQIVSEEFFWLQCYKAMKPALSNYAIVAGRTSPLEDPLVVTENRLRESCQILLDPFCPLALPESCPVSVIICTRDRAQDLMNCLTQLQQQVCTPEEIIVIDNGSKTTETLEVTQNFPYVKYFREDRPGLDIARNRGIAEAKCPIIAYTDDDTIPDPFWVFRVFETFQHPSIAAMTGLVIAASLSTEAEIIFEKYWPFNRGYVSKIYDDEFLMCDRNTAPPVWEIGAGANMAFRKEIFNEVGVFDERLDVGAAGCSGDSELWYRILAHGQTIHYNPMAVVKHSHRKSIDGLKKQLFHYMRGFTVAILIQYQQFGHRGNLKHLFKVLPSYYFSLLRKGFPKYAFQYTTLFAEIRGIASGLFYYVRHRNSKSSIS